MKLINYSTLFLLLAGTIFFSACQNKDSAPAAGNQQTSAAPAQEDTNWAKEDGIYAIWFTPKGKIVCRLEYTKAPMTSGNMVSLAEGSNPLTNFHKGQPFFDGLTFHRVVPGFVVQGGDPQGNGQGGPGYMFANESDPTLLHNRAGTLAMANAGPNTNGSQFYLTLAPTPNLDGGAYTVFGYVSTGQAVVNAISVGDKIDSLRIVRVGDAAKAWDAVTAFSKGMEASKAIVEETRKKRDEQMKQQEEMMKKQIEEHNKQVTAMAASYAGWDAKVKAKFPNAKKTKSGLFYIVETPGSGAVAHAGQTVVAHYTGTLWDGKKFDSSKDRGQPFEFPLGQHRVIDGWEEGFGLLSVGSKGKLIIPYYLAYGEQGTPGGPIGPKADLLFEVEMLGIK